MTEVAAGPVCPFWQRTTHLDSAAHMAQRPRFPSGRDRVWLILYADTAFDDLPDRAIIFDHLQAHCTCTFEQNFPSLRILLFQKPPR